MMFAHILSIVIASASCRQVYRFQDLRVVDGESYNGTPRVLQSSSSTSKLYNYVEIDLLPFTMSLLIIDIRHIYSYENSFVLNSEWNVSLTFTPTDDPSNSIELSLGKKFPPPAGFETLSNLPECISFLVGCVDPGDEARQAQVHSLPDKHALRQPDNELLRRDTIRSDEA